jgi:hypothetical protein
MKRIRILFAVCLLLASVVELHGLACTSFAVYSEKTLYGMNFDYPPNEIRFSIEEHEVGPVFIGSFWMGEHYGRTVGMNGHGLFASDQMVFPLRAGGEEVGEDETYVWEAFYSGLRECTTVDEVMAWIGERRLVQYPTLPLHNLYADPGGDAMVVEAGEDGNVVTEIDGPFLVMTNFHNGDFKGVGRDEIRGDGADRYRAATMYIEEHLKAFDIDHAFEALRQTAQGLGDFKTRYSLVFDPEAREIYIALERDYDHIWKVSLNKRTIEMYAGFDEDTILVLDEAGITGPTLQSYAAVEQPRTWIMPFVIFGGLLAIAAAAVILLFRTP